MPLVILQSDRVYVVCSQTTGVPLAVFASQKAAQADVDMVRDGRYVQPWVLRGVTFVDVPE